MMKGGYEPKRSASNPIPPSQRGQKMVGPMRKEIELNGFVVKDHMGFWGFRQAQQNNEPTKVLLEFKNILPDELTKIHECDLFKLLGRGTGHDCFTSHKNYKIKISVEMEELDL